MELVSGAVRGVMQAGDFRAELLLAKGEGAWNYAEFESKVAGKSPVLVLVESELGICGGLAAVPFLAESAQFVPDPVGASFVFSLRPTAARYPLEDKARAVQLWQGGSFWFGDCIGIYSYGRMIRHERTYAVTSGWEAYERDPMFTRFEVWRISL